MSQAAYQFATTQVWSRKIYSMNQFYQELQVTKTYKSLAIEGQ